MLSFVNKYGRNVYSQNNEDGILAECARRIPINHCVEIGGNDGRYCSNTAHLIDQGASGLFVEADHDLYLKCRENWKDNPRVRSQCSRVDGRNINAFVDESCDVLSTDTDGSDFEIFGGLKARPKIVIVEIDSSLDPAKPEFNSDGGASYSAMLRLGINKGYFLLCHTGNMIFVDAKYRELFPEIEGDGLSNYNLYFNSGWLKAA